MYLQDKIIEFVFKIDKNLKLLTEIDDIEKIDYEISKELNRKFIYLEDERKENYGLYYMNEVVIIVFLALFSSQHYEYLILKIFLT